MVNSLPDNPPGQADKENNWGNYVVIYDKRGFYVLLAHFKQNSIKVKEGDYVAVAYNLNVRREKPNLLELLAKLGITDVCVVFKEDSKTFEELRSKIKEIKTSTKYKYLRNRTIPLKYLVEWGVDLKRIASDVESLYRQRGYVKRTPLSEFSNPRSTGINAINLEPGDRLIYVGLVDEKDNLLLISKGGRAIRFHVQDVRQMGRSARGVRGMLLDPEDRIVAGTVVQPDDVYLLIVMEKGYGKRVLLSEFPLQRRGGKGLIAAKLSEKSGKIVDATTLKGEEPVIIVSKNGKIIRVNSGDIPVYGRHTRGVRIQRLSEDDVVVSVSKVQEVHNSC